ncbi:MAG: hypothetical protein WCA27_31170 [Candidatus Sulfotelmatobacter sp.]
MGSQPQFLPNDGLSEDYAPGRTLNDVGQKWASRKLNLRHPRFANIATKCFHAVLAKYSKSFSLIDCISVGVDRMQRNFDPVRKQLEAWQRSELTDVTAKVVIYEAFVEGKLDAPKHLTRTVHDLYFEPKYGEFRPRTIWSLFNAFTSAFKELDPIPHFKATAKLGEFLGTKGNVSCEVNRPESRVGNATDFESRHQRTT